MTSIGTLRELDAAVEAALSIDCRFQRHTGSELRADWLAILPCGCDTPVCSPCKSKEVATEPSRNRWCIRCGRRSIPPTEIRWEPLP